jgi:hypothetical protein
VETGKSKTGAMSLESLMLFQLMVENRKFTIYVQKKEGKKKTG